jgi:hypothetical protein
MRFLIIKKPIVCLIHGFRSHGKDFISLGKRRRIKRTRKRTRMTQSTN